MKLGLTLLLVGIVMVGGYGAYTMVRFIVLTDEVPIIMRIGLPTIVIGALVLLVKAIWDRLRERNSADVRRYEEAQP
ncbi:MAG: hypothetical protein F4X20_04000 [Dehalococcoidia bacterium]|nr:hypothetical protein [Dehalococcoidia bacterium]